MTLALRKQWIDPEAGTSEASRVSHLVTAGCSEVSTCISKSLSAHLDVGLKELDQSLLKGEGGPSCHYFCLVDRSRQQAP